MEDCGLCFYFRDIVALHSAQTIAAACNNNRAGVLLALTTEASSTSPDVQCKEKLVNPQSDTLSNLICSSPAATRSSWSGSASLVPRRLSLHACPTT